MRSGIRRGPGGRWGGRGADCTGGSLAPRADAELQFRGAARCSSHPADADVDATIVIRVKPPGARRAGSGSFQRLLHHQLRGTGDRNIASRIPEINSVLIRQFIQPCTISKSSMPTTATCVEPGCQPVHHPGGYLPGQGVERIPPHFAGKSEAIAVRVPTINVTAMD